MKTRWFFAVALAAAACGGDSRERTLHVFVWSDYLIPEVVEDFEAEFHCRVEETNFDTNEELRAKLLAGGAGFDLVCPTDYTVAQLVKDGALDEIDLSRLPNLKNLSPRLLAQWNVTPSAECATGSRIAKHPRA